VLSSLYKELGANGVEALAREIAAEMSETTDEVDENSAEISEGEDA
jgi:hypothetical protein